MRKQKIITLFVLIVLISFVSVPYVSAYLAAISGYSNLGQSESISNIWPNGSGSQSAMGESFLAGATGYLSQINVYLAKESGQPFAQCLLYEVSAFTDLPSAGVLVAQSAIKNYTEMDTFGTWQNMSSFSFVFNATYEIQAGNYYNFEVVSLAGSSSIRIGDSADGSGGGSYEGSRFWFVSNTWNTFAPFDLVFSVELTDLYGGVEPTPTPTPTPSPTPEAMPNWISDIIDAIIPIFTPLLVIFICGALGWRFAGAWGFFAGINLAIILVYVIAPTYMPLWAIVAVVIVDIALLFGKVGFDRR